MSRDSGFKFENGGIQDSDLGLKGPSKATCLISRKIGLQ